MSVSGFFEELEDKPLEDVPPVFRELATHMKTVLEDKGLLRNRKVSINGWTRELFLLTVEGTKLQQIKKVLYWYLENIKLQFVPSAFGGKSFRLKFHQIVSAMNRYLDEQQVEECKILPEVIQLQKEMGLIWPNGTKEKDQEQNTIQVTWDRVVQLRIEFKLRISQLEVQTSTLSKAGTKEWVQKRCLEEILHHIGQPRTFVEWWIRDIHRITWNWPAWRGNLVKWAFHRDNKKFRNLVQMWIREFCGNEIDINTILEKTSVTQ